jgi:hypothetical protein
LFNAFYNSKEIEISNDYYVGWFNCMSLIMNPTLAIIAPFLWYSVATVGVEQICKKEHQCDHSENQMLWDNIDYSGYEAI